MRIQRIGLLALLLLASGCAAFQPRARPVEPTAAALRRGPVPVNLGTLSGRVTLTNPAFGFLVVDYGGQRPPAIGTELKLYREGQPVGTIRLTEPTRGSLVTADILDGTPQVGDEVR